MGYYVSLLGQRRMQAYVMVVTGRQRNITGCQHFLSVVSSPQNRSSLKPAAYIYMYTPQIFKCINAASSIFVCRKRIKYGD